MTLKFDGWPKKKNNRASLPYYIKLCESFQIHRLIQTGVTVRKRSIWVKVGDFFVPCDRQIWWMTFKNNRAPLLYYVKLCLSFQVIGKFKLGLNIFLFHNQRTALRLYQLILQIQTWATVRKRSIRVKIGNFLFRVALKFDGWPWKTIGHLFYATSSFVHHFKGISEFKLQLQSGNTQFGSKSLIFLAVWHWNLTDDLEKQ